MHTCVYFTIADSRKQLICPPKGGWIKTTRYLHTVEHYCGIKEDRPGSSVEKCRHLGTAVVLETAMRSDITQTRKFKSLMISLIYETQIIKREQNRRQISGSREKERSFWNGRGSEMEGEMRGGMEEGQTCCVQAAAPHGMGPQRTTNRD